MKKIFLILAPVLLITAGCQTIFNKPAPNSTINSTSTTINVPANPNLSRQKFIDSKYFQNSYLISDDILSTQAKKALTGFQISKETMPDGSVKISLKATESGYQDQQYILKAGQMLYFIDKNLGDDSGSEKNQGDDFGIVVDSSGYIVQ